MATSSEVKAGLDNIAVEIRSNRQRMVSVKTIGADVSTALGALATNFADVVATINGYAAGTTNTFEQLAKAELAKLVTEYTALKADADTVAAIDLG